MVRKGLPAVVVVTEQFERLAGVIMQSQNVPAGIAILVEGNPEFVSEEALAAIAERVLEEAARRLTGLDASELERRRRQT